MYKTWQVYDKVGEVLLYTGETVQARTKDEAIREGSKNRTGEMTGFVMVEVEAEV